RELGVECRVRRFDTNAYASENSCSIQEAARTLRYEWFAEERKQKLEVIKATHLKEGSKKRSGSILPAVWVLTAHHADDNIETLLMNFFKGTGMAGLHGIRPRQDGLIRPMLCFRKAELLQWAGAAGWSWVEDSSNLTDKYSRNFIRQQLIPLIASRYPAVEDNLLQNIRRFTEAEQLYNEAIARRRKKLLQYNGREWQIPVLLLKKQEPLATVVYEIAKEFGFGPAQAPEIIRLLDASSGKFMVSSTHRIIRNRNWLLIAPLKDHDASCYVWEGEDTVLDFPDGTLAARTKAAVDLPLPSDPLMAALDASQIQFPLLIRKWKAGDYFYPLGMKKKKKLSRFFIDAKLSRTQKESVWVIEMDKKIIWVIGYRIDDRFKLNPATKQALLITCRQKGL
ncbi:MAG TPA: tRNA lysidine(34) synthetase TilS, partial [Chitinophagaceae bacterium]|nr:tRNA lysidine(34) synthetase TilS [Chitinophagaceae bacterium]